MTELETDALTITGELADGWRFDESDLRRPHADQVLGELIDRRPVERQARLREEFFGLGPLAPLVEDPAVTEILVNGADAIWFERDGRLHPHDDRFLSAPSFDGFVERVCTEAGVKVDLSQPFADGRWRGFRLHVGRAPLTSARVHVSLRRAATRGWTLDGLVAAGWCDAAAATLLRRLTRERANILVIGTTGAGKTSVLGALLAELDDSERAVILEDTDEIRVPNRASTKLLGRPTLGPQLAAIDLGELVRQSLRMRPDRLVVGEVRGGEAKDLLLALATGHSGSLGTLHAGDARQALLRLEMLVQLGAPQWSLAAIRRLLHLSVDAFVRCDFKDGRRTLGGVDRVAGLEEFGLLLEPLGQA